MVYIGVSDSDSDSDVTSVASSHQAKNRRKGKQRQSSASAASSQRSSDSAESSNSGSDSEDDEDEDEDAPPPVSRLDDEDMSDAEDYSYKPEPVSVKKSKKPKESPARSTQSSDSGLEIDDELSRTQSGSHSGSDDIEIDDTFEEAKARKDLRPQPTNLDRLLSQNADPARTKVMQASLFASKRAPLAAKKPLTGPVMPKPAFSFGDAPTVQQSKDDRPPAQQAKPLQQPKQRTPRPHVLVSSDQSVMKDKEGLLSDAGLMMGRSFRAGWGPDGRLITLNGLGKVVETSIPKIRENPSRLSSDKIKSVSLSESSAGQAAENILSIQREHTDVFLDNNVPVASTHPDLRFHHFQESSTETHEKNLFKLGHALFDELEDLRLPADASLAQQSHITSLSRRRALSDWLEDAVSSSIERDLRNNTSQSVPHTIFTYLTGHQIERACHTAIENNDLHLATLLAQAGGDDEFRSDLFLQLAKWREYRVDAHIDPGYRKIYELLSGNISTSEGYKPNDPVDGCPSISIPKELDWKRVLGLHLWYGAFDASMEYAVKRYEESWSDEAAKPITWYEEAKEAIKWNSNLKNPVWDAQFELLKLATGQADGLEQALLPRGFSASPLDVRLAWHCYVLLARSLRLADFADRLDARDVVPEGEDPAYPNWSTSALADGLTESYAAQLELIGEWEWAVFVLLHLSHAESRLKGIKDLLLRNVAHFDDRSEAHLQDSLCVPAAWIAEAKALQCKSQGRIWEEMKFYLSADMFSEAHRLLVYDLAPEAVLRGDVKLLIRLFDELDDVQDQVADWQSGGQIYLDYAACITTLPDLLRKPSKSSQLDTLINQTIPNLLSVLPTFLLGKSAAADQRDLKRSATVSEMLSRVSQVEAAVTKVRSQNIESNTSVGTLQESDRIVWLQNMSSNMFSSSLDTLGV